MFHSVKHSGERLGVNENRVVFQSLRLLKTGAGAVLGRCCFRHVSTFRRKGVLLRPGGPRWETRTMARNGMAVDGGGSEGTKRVFPLLRTEEMQVNKLLL